MSGPIETFRGHVKLHMCDHLGHMNLGRYLEICGDGIFYMQSLLGFDPADAVAGRGCSFAAVQVEANFRAEVRPGESLRLITGLVEIGTRSCTFTKRIHSGADDRLVFEARLKSAYLDLGTRRAVAIPDELRNRLGEFRCDEDGQSA